jgi:large subunit ribosomal protein L30e
MVEQQLLAKILKEAMKGGRYSIGASEVVSEMKGSKLIILSKSLPGDTRTKLAEEAKKNNVKVIDLEKNSTELGRMIGRPFRVSALALRSVSDSELRQLIPQ